MDVSEGNQLAVVLFLNFKHLPIVLSTVFGFDLKLLLV